MLRPTNNKDWYVRRNSSSSTSNLAISPQEDALQSLCKQLVKSRFFRGCYQERRYVDSVGGYRDIISLHRNERELERLLLEVKRKLQLFYQYVPNMWVGITSGNGNASMHTLDTHLWVQLEDIAFGQYWFTVKSIRFRMNEIILKLKMVRSVDNDTTKTHYFAAKRHAESAHNTTALMIKRHGENGGDNSNEFMEMPIATIGMDDFVNVLRGWSTNVKHTVYDFMSNDINKDNIRDFLQFLGLLVVSLLTGTVVAIKYLGTFALRFMFEFTRFTHAMTPIVLKLIEVVNKIIGGFYILIAMIWKDAVMKRNRQPHEQIQSAPLIRNAIEYERPLRAKIESNLRPQKRLSTEFERNYQ